MSKAIKKTMVDELTEVMEKFDKEFQDNRQDITDEQYVKVHSQFMGLYKDLEDLDI